MEKPIVAVVGRPNVGKSTLFNKLIGQRLAIVEDTPGVTRDRIFGECEWQNHEFLLVDTGGIDPNEADGEQLKRAIGVTEDAEQARGKDAQNAVGDGENGDMYRENAPEEGKEEGKDEHLS